MSKVKDAIQKIDLAVSAIIEHEAPDEEAAARLFTDHSINMQELQNAIAEDKQAAIAAFDRRLTEGERTPTVGNGGQCDECKHQHIYAFGGCGCDKQPNPTYCPIRKGANL